MIKIKHLFAAGMAALVLGTAAPASANFISDILSGADRGFGYSGLHVASGPGGMSGSHLGGLSLDTSGPKSSFIGDAFELFALLDNGDHGTVRFSGNLDFGNPAATLIGSLDAYFDMAAQEYLTGALGLTVDAAPLTFSFGNVIIPIAGYAVPSPNSTKGDLLTLWGAVGGRYNPNTGGFDDDPLLGNSTIGMDLVVRWVEVPEPGSLELLAASLLGLLGFGVVSRRRRAVAAAAA